MLSLDAQFKPGLWQSSFFTVTRQEEGEINIKQAVFPRPWSPDRTIEVTELRLSRGHTEPNCTSIQLGMGDLGRSWTVDSFPESKDYPRDTVQKMLKQAESLMPDGELAFLSGPMDQSGKLAAWSGPSPL